MTQVIDDGPNRMTLLSTTSSATTYSFATTRAGFHSWALCTVNDATGELLITSDCGSWSHRWNPRPGTSLTTFIGHGDVDYLARKLQHGHRPGRVFSAQATARALQRRLCKLRLNDGRCQLEHRLVLRFYDCGRLPNHLMDRYTEAGLPLFSGTYVSVPSWRDPHRQERLRYLMRDEARRLWKELHHFADELDDANEDLFFERLPSISGFSDYMTDEPWNYLQTVQTAEDKALRGLILPALIEACRAAACDTGAST